MKTTSIISAIIILFGLTNCRSKQVQNNNIQTMEIITTFDISSRTKIFLIEFNKEFAASKKSLLQFVPSEKLAEKYILRMMENKYFMSGTMVMGKDFDTSQLDKIGVRYQLTVNQIMPVYVPISNLQDFFMLKNVQYFEISQKLEHF